MPQQLPQTGQHTRRRRPAHIPVNTRSHPHAHPGSAPGIGPYPGRASRPAPRPAPASGSGSDSESDSGSDSTSDSRHSPAIPLEKQAVFGAGLKRKRITFVPASTRQHAESRADQSVLPTPRVTPAQRYWSIVSSEEQTLTTTTNAGKTARRGTSGMKEGGQGVLALRSRDETASGNASGTASSLLQADPSDELQQNTGQDSGESTTEWTTESENDENDEHETKNDNDSKNQPSSPGICPICHLRLDLTTHSASPSTPHAANNPGSANPSQHTSAQPSAHTHQHKHESLLAHQVSLPHIHPPSALDRRRMGVRYLAAWGWDVDSRTGLGKSGSGRRDFVRVVNKQDTLGLGVDLPKGAKKNVKKTTLNARQARAWAVKNRRRAEELRATLFGREDEVQRVLHGG